MIAKLATRSRLRRRAQGKGGFTAVEVTMVAAIIAILTLIALPMFRKRVEKARINAALDEMTSLGKAEMLAFAETDHHYRLNDLDNTTQYSDSDTSSPLGVPMCTWNRLLTRAQRRQLSDEDDGGWNGPYIAVRKYDTLFNITDPALYDSLVWRYWGQTGGPIMLLPDVGNPQDDHLVDRYPLDPWGNPYIFFGIGAMNPGSSNDDGRRFPNCVIYSMGPNGLPGDGSLPINQENYWRYPPLRPPTPDRNYLGFDDDLTYEF